MDRAPTDPGRCVLLAEEAWGTALHAARSVAANGGETVVVTAGDGAALVL